MTDLPIRLSNVKSLRDLLVLTQATVTGGRLAADYGHLMPKYSDGWCGTTVGPERQDYDMTLTFQRTTFLSRGGLHKYVVRAEPVRVFISTGSDQKPTEEEVLSCLLHRARLSARYYNPALNAWYISSWIDKMGYCPASSADWQVARLAAEDAGKLYFLNGYKFDQILNSSVRDHLARAVDLALPREERQRLEKLYYVHRD